MKAHKLTLLFGCLAGIILVSGAYTIETIGNDETGPYLTEKDEQVPQPKLPTSLKSIFQLKVKEDHITKECFKTSEVKLHDIPWKIELCKVPDNNINLKLSLVAVFNDDIAYSSCQANADFELVHSSDVTKNKKVNLNGEFSRASQKYTDDKFIKWSEFTKEFVKDGVATFKIELTIERPVSAFVAVSTDFQVKVLNVHDEKGTRSSEVVVRGIRWYVLAKKFKLNDVDTFAVFIYGNTSDMDANYGYEVVAKIKLWSNKKSIERELKPFSFNWRSPGYGFTSFITFKELTKTENGYVFGNSALFEIFFTVNEPKPLSKH